VERIPINQLAVLRKKRRKVFDRKRLQLQLYLAGIHSMPHKAGI
jgi:hypothetical protein